MYMYKRSGQGLPWEDVAREAPTLDEFLDMLHRSGSEATSCEEMPRSLVLKLSGAARHTLVQLLTDLDVDSQWWRMVIRLCLINKFPTWLLRNSRPILLEAFICRPSATNVFHRMQIRSELVGLLPSEFFAFRKQLSPQAAAMVGRLLIPEWCKKHGVLFSVDWDEKNALCNVARPGQDVVTRHPALRVER